MVEVIKGVPDKEELEKYCKMVREAFGFYITDQDTAKHIYDVDEFYRIVDGGELVGFCSVCDYDVDDIDYKYLSGIVVKKGRQRKGVCKDVLSQVFDGDVVSFRTQNPAMYMCGSHLGEIYPNLKGEYPRDVVKIAYDTARRLGCKMEDNFVVKGVYGGRIAKGDFGLFRKLGLDPDNGDGVICVVV